MYYWTLTVWMDDIDRRRPEHGRIEKILLMNPKDGNTGYMQPTQEYKSVT